MVGLIRMEVQVYLDCDVEEDVAKKFVDKAVDRVAKTKMKGVHIQTVDSVDETFYELNG